MKQSNVINRLAKLVALCAFASALAFGLMGCSGGGGQAESQSASSAPASSSAPAPAVQDKGTDVALPTEPYYVLIMGNDSRKGTVQGEGRVHADTIMAMRIDPVNYQISLLTVPRDTPYFYEGELVKINDPYGAGGPKTETEVVSDHTGIDFDHYLSMGFVDFVNFYNDIGGLDVNVPLSIGWQDIVTGNDVGIEAGEQHLNGNELLVFARVRKAYYHSESARQNMDRLIVKTSVSTFAENPEKIEELLTTFLKYAETDWDKKQLQAQIEDFSKNADKITFQEGTLPYEGGVDERNELWMCIEDPETTAEVVRVFKEGGDPTTVLPLVPMDPA